MEDKKRNHSWDEEEINPEAPMRIPDGYRYVNPEEKILRTVSRGRGDPAGVRDREYAEIYKNANDR